MAQLPAGRSSEVSVDVYRGADESRIITGAGTSVTVTCECTSALTWKAWNSAHYTVSVSSTEPLSHTYVWQIWNNDYGGTCTSVANEITITRNGTGVNASDGIIWTAWNGTYVAATLRASATGSSGVNNYARERIDPARTAAQQQEFIAAEAERANARARAQMLLRESLSEQQRMELAEKGYFHLDVLSANGERRRYRIRRGRAGNVQRVSLDGSQVLKTLCIHPRMMVPDEDTMLAQKLLLEAREEDFLAIANHS